MGWLLALASYGVFLLALPFLLTHPKLRHGIRARCGLYPAGWPEIAAGPRVWVHGASAGDVLALLPTVRALHAARPDIQVIGTTITNSGYAMAQRHADAFAAVSYLPYDVPLAVHRALGRIRPDVLVLEYTELWPQLIRAAAKRGVAVVLHNGRFSAARLERYRWLFALTGNLLRHFTLLLMRDANEAERAEQLGALAGRVVVTGNTKFDNLQIEPAAGKIDELRAALAAAPDDLLWVVGSTHEGEEELLFGVLEALRRQHPHLRMLIAPRYVERADRLVSLAQRQGLSARRRSRTGAAVDVLVLDTIGELAACYSLADVVFVGGSFARRGGQNILEPAACGKPVIFGPNMQNFADSVQVLLGRGGMQVANPAQLQRVMGRLLSHPDELRELGETARAQVLAVRGAATRNAELVVKLIEARAARSDASDPTSPPR